jgi:SAM-dependent methyltransferase
VSSQSEEFTATGESTGPEGFAGFEGFDDAYGTATAHFYDAAYGAMPSLGADVDFYTRLARDLAGPVLELGCGTGRTLLEVAATGLPCSGVDLSQPMLDRLKQRNESADVPAELRLVQAPMQDFDLAGARFELIFSAFRAFQHLATVAEQLACLACVRRHLAPGGVLAFDVFNPRYGRLAELEEPESEDLRFRLGDLDVIRYAHVKRDPARQLLHVKMRYETWRDGQVESNQLSQFDMRWFHRYELEHLLARAGFDDVAIYGDFDGGPVTTDSPAFVVVAA